MIQLDLSGVGRPTDKMFQYAMVINGWVHAVSFNDLYRMDYDQCHSFIDQYKDQAEQIRKEHDLKNGIRRHSRVGSCE